MNSFKKTLHVLLAIVLGFFIVNYFVSNKTDYISAVGGGFCYPEGHEPKNLVYYKKHTGGLFSSGLSECEDYILHYKR